MGPWFAHVLRYNGLIGGWYAELYAGGAGVALYLLANGYVDHILLNDKDPFIHAFWRSVVQDTDDFIEKIRKTPVTMDSRSYFQYVLKNADSYSTLEVGFAAFFLNRTSRSGVLTGGAIGGKAQGGAYKIDSRYNRDELVSRVQALGALRSRITVVGMDALDFLRERSASLPEKTVIYLDPPYYVKGAGLYRHHYRRNDHADLAQCIREVSRPVLVSYDDTPEVRRLYSGMPSVSFSFQYCMNPSCPGGDEVLFYSNLCLPAPPNLAKSSGVCAPLSKGSQLGLDLSTARY